MFTILTDLIYLTRQHHAIEHATIHMLARRFPHQRFSGHSDPLGFTIYGDVDEESLRHSVGDALLRLQAGEQHLALHPNCGTNFVTSAVLVTLAALIAGSGKRSFFERFTLALFFVIPALILSKPLGYRFQSYTTVSDVSDRWVLDIQPLELGPIQAYRVFFE